MKVVRLDGIMVIYEFESDQTLILDLSKMSIKNVSDDKNAQGIVYDLIVEAFNTHGEDTYLQLTEDWKELLLNENQNRLEEENSHLIKGIIKNALTI